MILSVLFLVNTAVAQKTIQQPSVWTDKNLLVAPSCVKQVGSVLSLLELKPTDRSDGVLSNNKSIKKNKVYGYSNRSHCDYAEVEVLPNQGIIVRKMNKGPGCSTPKQAAGEKKRLEEARALAKKNGTIIGGDLDFSALDNARKNEVSFLFQPSVGSGSCEFLGLSVGETTVSPEDCLKVPSIAAAARRLDPVEPYSTDFPSLEAIDVPQDAVVPIIRNCDSKDKLAYQLAAAQLKRASRKSASQSKVNAAGSSSGTKAVQGALRHSAGQIDH
jgi:hypothetical protein